MATTKKKKKSTPHVEEQPQPKATGISGEQYASFEKRTGPPEAEEIPVSEQAPDFPGIPDDAAEPTPETPEEQPKPPSFEERTTTDINAIVQSCTSMVTRLIAVEDAVRELHSSQQLLEGMFNLLMQHTLLKEKLPGMSPFTGAATPFGLSQEPAPPPMSGPIPNGPPDQPTPNVDYPEVGPMPQEPPRPIGGTGPMPELAQHPEYHHVPGSPDPSQPLPFWIPIIHNPQSPDRPRGCGYAAYFLTRVFAPDEVADLTAMRIKPPGEAIWRAPRPQGESPVCSACGASIDPWAPNLDMDFSVLQERQQQEQAYRAQQDEVIAQAEPGWQQGGTFPGHTPEAQAQVIGNLQQMSRAVYDTPTVPPPPPLNLPTRDVDLPSSARPVRSSGRMRP